MNEPAPLTQSQLLDFLLNVAVVRPVFVWGAPGIGKSALVERFAHQVGLDCVSLLGSQLAPEDLIGVPQLLDGKSRFCPPTTIARDEAYCLFLDELNACSHEVQKAFYSLIHERRIGEYHLPEGSVVIGAGNRAQDNAIVKPMSSALMNRMVHVHLTVSRSDWMTWAQGAGIHQWVTDYLTTRGDHLWSQPPKHEAPFSTPRSWHMFSDALHEFGEDINEVQLAALAHGLLTPSHASQFLGFLKQKDSRELLREILAGHKGWPHQPKDRDLLYFLVQAFRARVVQELPVKSESLSGGQREFAHQAKGRLTDLAAVSLEMAQLVVATEEGETSLPAWFLREVVRDIPRLAAKRDK